MTESILKKLENASVLRASIVDDKIKLYEGCEEHFSCILTKEEVIKLANELLELVKK